VRDTDESEVTLTTSEPWVATGTPRWSPDGASLLYYRSILGAQEDPDNGVYIIGSDGSGPRRLTTGVNPAWSPDGQHVVVTRCCDPGAPGAPEVWIIHADARDPAEARLLARGTPLGWTPDGRAVLIGPSGDDAEGESQLVDSSGNVVGQFSLEGGFVGWSPDGTQLLFYRGGESGAGGVYRADAAGGGSDAQLVVELPPLAAALGWQPRLEPMD
jgi:Tol biopolymer transport system component